MSKTKPSAQQETFGKRMAKLRKDAGFTQRALAAELGISQRMIAYYEGQTEYPPAHLIPALSEVLGASADELLGIVPLKARRPTNQRLWRRFRQIEKLPAQQRKQLLAVIDTFLDRERLQKKSS